MTAPAAAIGTSPCCNDGDGTHSVPRSPCVDVFLDGDRFAARPRLPIEIGDQSSGPRSFHFPFFPEEGNPVHTSQRCKPASLQGGQELFQSLLGFPNDNDVGARIEILFYIVCGRSEEHTLNSSHTV